jgi:hypothetical protein
LTMPKPRVNHNRDEPRAQPTMSLVLLVQVGGIPGRRGRAQSSRALVSAFGLPCPINPEFSRTSGGARAPGSYRTSPEASVGEQLCLAGCGGASSLSRIYLPSRNPIRARPVVRSPQDANNVGRGKEI